MKCYAYLRNIVDILIDGRTPYERRFHEPFDGPAIPYGTEINYLPSYAKDKKRLHQFGVKT